MSGSGKKATAANLAKLRRENEELQRQLQESNAQHANAELQRQLTASQAAQRAVGTAAATDGVDSLHRHGEHPPPDSRETSPPPKKQKTEPKLSAAARLSQQQLRPEAASSSTRPVASISDVEKFFEANFGMYSAKIEQVRTSAEIRRLITIMYGGAMLHAVEVQDNATHRSEALEFVMASLQHVAQLLVEYDRAGKLAQGDYAAKVTKLEQGIISAMSATAPQIGDRARAWLPVPDMGARATAKNAGYHATTPPTTGYVNSRRSYPRPEASVAASAPMQDVASFASVMTPFMTMMQSAATAAAAAAAPPPPPKLTPTEIAMKAWAAAMTPQATANQQFAPERRSGPLVCYHCQEEGHVQSSCPTSSLPRVPKGQKRGPAGSSVSNQPCFWRPAHEIDKLNAATAMALPKMTAPLATFNEQRDKPVLQESEEPSVLHAISSIESQKSLIGTHCSVSVPLCDHVSTLSSKQFVHDEEQERKDGKDCKVIIEDECDCGRCGTCLQGLDLMPKEKKARDSIHGQPPRSEMAQRVEQQQAAMIALLESLDPKNTGPNYLTSDTSADSGTDWRLQAAPDECETSQQMQAEWPVHSAPARSPISLREIMKEGKFGKKAFNKWDRSCTFCKRRGHTRQTCMMAPVDPDIPFPAATPLQKAKQKFVLDLLKRPAAPKVETLRDGRTRLQTVEEVLRLGEEADKENPWADSPKRRDKLRKALGFWWAIGADATTIGWIGFGVRLRFEDEPESLSFPNHKSYWEEKEHIEKECQIHIEDGSFQEVEGTQIKIGNPLQVEINEKGKRRQCADCRYPNRFLADYDFTQEGLAHTAQIVKQDIMMITTDVAKAYYQVPLHKESQRYCAWRHNGKWIIPTIIIFGLSVAPFIFTKIMRVVLRFMRALDIRGTNCIDDNLWAEFKEGMEEVKAIVQLVFGKLGWQFNEKCEWTPSTVVIYNGMILDSHRFEIRAVEHKIELARKLAWSIWFAARDGKAVQLRDLQRLTGRLMSMRLALEGVTEWTRGLYADIAKTLEECQQKPSKRQALYLREEALSDINFWALRLGKQNGLPIRDEGDEVHVQVWTDASDVGWGAHRGGEGTKLHGVLPKEVLGSSSTAREIAGVIAATRLMQEELRGRRVRIIMDSYPAIRNFINGGGPKAELNALVKEWWLWCKAFGVTPLYRWIERSSNVQADELSKIAAMTYELEEDSDVKIRRWLVELGLPGLDSNQWKRTRVLAPHFDKIPARLHEMRRGKAPACIVVPRWAGAVWRAELLAHSSHRVKLGSVRAVLLDKAVAMHPSWEMEAHLITPAC